MAIKNLRFSFDVPLTELLALIATRNDSLRIDVIGDGKEAKQPKQLRNGAQAIAGLIEGPARRNSNGSKVRGKDEHGHAMTGRQLIAKTLMAAPDHTSTNAVLKAALAAHGLKPQSVSPQLSVMRADGDVKQNSDGTYRATGQGVRNFMKLLRDRDAKIAAQKGVQP
jgi:hypothetical protein